MYLHYLVETFNGDSIVHSSSGALLGGGDHCGSRFREEHFCSSVRPSRGYDHASNYSTSHGSVVANSLESSRFQEGRVGSKAIQAGEDDCSERTKEGLIGDNVRSIVEAAIHRTSKAIGLNLVR
jgi:hypothetical protein